MARLLVNPGTPQQWEIKLKPGPNRIGRSDDNDFTVPHSSVSGNHCEVILSDGGVVLRDLGSTNGSFINRAPIKEGSLQPGYHIQLGAVDMIFEADAPVTATVALGAAIPPSATAAATPAVPTGLRLSVSTAKPATPAPAPAAASGLPPIPPPVSAQPKPAGLRLSASAHAPAAPVAAEPDVAMEDTGDEAALPSMVPMLSTGAMCKFHPKALGRFYCSKCQKYFCDMCVSARATAAGQIKTCRACGVSVTPVHVPAASLGSEKGFFAKLPESLVYPFKGAGVLILICATIVFTVLDMMSGGFSIFMTIFAVGYLFLFMQNIIHSSTSDEKETLSFPGMDGVYGACFSLVGTVGISFGLAIGLLIAKFNEVDVPTAALVAATIFGCFYFPMAFLAVAMKDTVMAANPLVVIPSILKVPLEYLVTTIILLAVFGIRRLGEVLSSIAGLVSLTTTDMSQMFMAFGFKMIWAIISMYLLVVTMRVLAILYNTSKHKLGWFSR